jgi:hypothetical protein
LVMAVHGMKTFRSDLARSPAPAAPAFLASKPAAAVAAARAPLPDTERTPLVVSRKVASKPPNTSIASRHHDEDRKQDRHESERNQEGKFETARNEGKFNRCAVGHRTLRIQFRTIRFTEIVMVRGRRLGD